MKKIKPVHYLLLSKAGSVWGDTGPYLKSGQDYWRKVSSGAIMTVKGK